MEHLRGRCVTTASASKHHSLITTADGDIFSWGGGDPVPRRVPLPAPGDDGAAPLTYHRAAPRRRAVAVAAGATMSAAVTEDGAVLCWASANARAGAVVALPGRRAVAVAAAKHSLLAVLPWAP